MAWQSDPAHTRAAFRCFGSALAASSALAVVSACSSSSAQPTEPAETPSPPAADANAPAQAVPPIVTDPAGGGAPAAGGAPSGVATSPTATPSEPGAAAGSGSNPVDPPTAPGTPPGEDSTDTPPGLSVPLDDSLLSACSGGNPILCALPVAPGNYHVAVELGAADRAGVTSIQTETRHFQALETATAIAGYSLHLFTVNVRAEVHDGGQSAPGDLLELALGGSAPLLHGVGLLPAPEAMTLFIASDSTAADWVATNTSALADDEAGWGQELSLYFEPGVAIANYADSGETAASFYGKFFPAARDAMKTGDYLFIQFGHNDQKLQADIDNYQANLLRYVDDARTRGVTPVLLTPVSRSTGTAANPGFAGLDQQVRELASAESIALIDLTALSRDLYATAPDSSGYFIDGTHFHEGGAIAVARVVADAIQASELPIREFIRPR